MCVTMTYGSVRMANQYSPYLLTFSHSRPLTDLYRGEVINVSSTPYLAVFDSCVINKFVTAGNRMKPSANIFLSFRRIYTCNLTSI